VLGRERDERIGDETMIARKLFTVREIEKEGLGEKKCRRGEKGGRTGKLIFIYV
jgi:hypothetical protein